MEFERSDYPENLLLDMGLTVPEKDMGAAAKRLEEVLSKLNEQEQTIILGYYRDGRTLQDLGDQLGISRERVRQIKEKRVKRLRNSTVVRYVLDGLSFTQEYVELIRRLEGRIDDLTAENERLKRQLRGEPEETAEEKRDKKELDRITLESMGFPVRAFDALFMHDYRTAGDFVGKTENDIRGLHGVGEETFEDICRVLERYGISLQKE